MTAILIFPLKWQVTSSEQIILPWGLGECRIWWQMISSYQRRSCSVTAVCSCPLGNPFSSTLLNFSFFRIGRRRGWGQRCCQQQYWQSSTDPRDLPADEPGLSRSDSREDWGAQHSACPKQGAAGRQNKECFLVNMIDILLYWGWTGWQRWATFVCLLLLWFFMKPGDLLQTLSLFPLPLTGKDHWRAFREAKDKVERWQNLAEQHIPWPFYEAILQG